MVGREKSSVTLLRTILFVCLFVCFYDTMKPVKVVTFRTRPIGCNRKVIGLYKCNFYRPAALGTKEFGYITQRGNTVQFINKAIYQTGFTVMNYND